MGNVPSSLVQLPSTNSNPILRVLGCKPPDETVQPRRNPLFLVAVTMKQISQPQIRKKESLLFLLLAHHGHDQLQRTIHLKLGSQDLYLCARGVGRYSGIIAIFILKNFLSIPLWLYPLSFVIFPIPSTIDWALQKACKRESSNSIRIPTGFLVGVSQGLFIISYLQGLSTIFNFGIIIMSVYFLVFCLAKYCKGRVNHV